MLILSKTLQRTYKIYAVEIEPGAVPVDSVRIEGMTDDGVVGLFVRLHTVALHQTLGRIHLYEAVRIDHLAVAVPIEGVCEGMLSLDEVLDVDVAVCKPLLLALNCVVTGAVGVDLGLEKTVGRITEHLESAAVYLVSVLLAVIRVVVAFHPAGTHIVGEVGPLEAAGHHPVHCLHGSLRKIDGRNINIGVLARNKNTDEDEYEKCPFQPLFESTDCRGLAKGTATYGVGIAVLNVIHKGVGLLREVSAILRCLLVGVFGKAGICSLGLVHIVDCNPVFGTALKFVAAAVYAGPDSTDEQVALAGKLRIEIHCLLGCTYGLGVLLQFLEVERPELEAVVGGLVHIVTATLDGINQGSCSLVVLVA